MGRPKKTETEKADYERVHIALPHPLMERLREVAKADRRTLSATIELRITESLRELGEAG